MSRSLLPEFYRLTPAERRAVLQARGVLDEHDLQILGGPDLGEEAADCMIENVIGRFSLPLAIATSFLVNGKEYLVPMVVEEPSIVAGVSAAAKLARAGGGFTSRIGESLLAGQIQLLDVPDVPRALCDIGRNREELLEVTRGLQPRLVARGGGVRELHAFALPAAGMIEVRLLVDTADAMGANLVNSCCEALAPLLARLTGGVPLLRILSNLTERSLVTSRIVLPAAALESRGLRGEEVRDRIVRASEFAAADEHRAATHNKGIMNGIDAVAVATGNDWRALEAGAHAYAAYKRRYAPLASWRTAPCGGLEGVIEIPLKVGIVGAQAEAHPGVRLARKILGVGSAKELAEVMGAVGLAQNLAALRALVTRGISEGHLKLHARAVALAAECPPELFDAVVTQLIGEKEIKVWRAKEILRTLLERASKAA